MHDLSQKVISKIKEEHIVPESKRMVFVYSAAFWVLMGAMLFVGSIAASLVIMNVADIDPRFFRHMPLGKFLRIFFDTAPYLWLLLLGGALVFGVLAFRKTKRGYRFRTLFVTSVAVLMVFVLGVFGHFLKVGDHVKKVAGTNFHRIADGRGDRWQRPQDGLVSGKIAEVGAHNFGLRSFDGSIWMISVDDDTEYIDGIKPVFGERVSILGEVIQDFSMRAFSVKAFPVDAEEDFIFKPSSRRGDGDADDDTGISLPISH